MKKIKAKLATILVATSCFIACLVCGVTSWVTPMQTAITANAASTTYTITKLGGLSTSTNTHINAYSLEGDAPGVNSWEYAFTFEDGTGDGFLYNGEVLSAYEVKQPGTDFYIVPTGKTAVEGDTVVLDGTFSNATADAAFVFNNCGLKYNGSTWETYTPPTTHEIGSLVLHGNSSGVGSAAGNSAVLYLQRADGNALPILSWGYAFTYESGTGFCVNDEQKTPSSIKSTGDGFYWAFDAVSAGDVITIGGTFYNEDLAVKYIIEESKFVYNGSAWETYIDYTTYEYDLGKATLDSLSSTAGNNAVSNYIYLDWTAGSLPDDWNAWDNILDYSNVTYSVNGTSSSILKAVVSYEWLFVEFAAVDAGTYITISGTFTYTDANTAAIVKITLDEVSFTWNGSAWETYVDYTTYEYTIGKLSVVSPSNTSSNNIKTCIYLEADIDLPQLGWNAAYFTCIDGDGVQVNGEKVSAATFQSVGEDNRDIYLYGFSVSNVGDVVSIAGTFSATNGSIKYLYVIEESVFEYNGSWWVASISDDALEYSDTINIRELGFNMTETFDATSAAVDHTGLYYVATSSNTTNSVKFRFGFNSNSTSGNLEIRLRGTNWCGIRFILNSTSLYSHYSSTSTTVSLTENTYYVIELGAIDTTDGENVFIYAKVDGALMIADLISKTAINPNEDGTPAFSTFTTTGVSLYFGKGTKYILSDPDHIVVTYTHANGSFTEYAPKNDEYTLAGAKGYGVFIGWATADNTLYGAEETIAMGEESLTFTAVEIDFYVQDGAAIRLANTADESGIRYTSYIKTSDLDKLSTYGVTNYTFGTLIMPYDYLGAGQAPNLTDFTVGTNMLQLPSTYSEISEEKTEYTVYRGAMNSLKEGNYDRLFAGRGYMTLTFSDGATKTIYTHFDTEDNVRSVRYVAQALQEDTEVYSALSTGKKAVVDTYAAADTIDLLPYEAYAANNGLNVIAWYYPELDSSSAYSNDKNVAIATKMKETGVKAVYLDGEYHLNLTTYQNIEKTRQIIEFFWSQGLYTIAYGGEVDYTTEAYPDFSACDGFIGFLVYDEPSSTDVFTTLAEYAKNFESMYAGTDVTFMVNLLPSYASTFNGETKWWETSIDSLDKDTYKAYLQSYCETVLSQVQGEKWLSMDSYPINADKSLTANFLFDLAMLKYYAETYEAHSHAVLQSSGWKEVEKNEAGEVTAEHTEKYRMPTAAEMRMQAYAAMAFGIDSISWWSYSDMRYDEKKETDQYNPTDNDEYYGYFKEVNNELAAISSVYGAFDWKGIILGTGKDDGWLLSENNDYVAYNLVSGQIGDYELSASDTKNLSSVSTNETSLNYLMGVMEDMSGNEGYVLCNYNSHEEDRAQTITLKFNKNITQVVIYCGGVATTVDVTDQTLTVDLATGEGVFVIPCTLG